MPDAGIQDQLDKYLTDAHSLLTVGDEGARVPAGDLALIPADVAHEVRNSGQAKLRFVAAYASAEVVTHYEREVQPDGSSQRDPLG